MPANPNHLESATYELGQLADVISLLGRTASFEATPQEVLRDEAWSERMPRGTHVYIPHAPKTELVSVADAARKLRSRALVPVPHVAARRLRSDAELLDFLARLRDAGCEDVFVIGGSIAKPQSGYRSALDLLNSGLLERHGFSRAGVAGHPEGSPEIAEPELWRVLEEKNRFAAATRLDMHVVTQFCFEPASIENWERRARARGNRLPVHVGVPGLASTASLLRFAAMCGVRVSGALVRRGLTTIARSLTDWSPGRLLLRVAACMTGQPESSFSRVHFFPFGGLRRTVAWAQALGEGRFSLQIGRFGAEIVDVEALA